MKAVQSFFPTLLRELSSEDCIGKPFSESVSIRPCSISAIIPHVDYAMYIIYTAGEFLRERRKRWCCAANAIAGREAADGVRR
jgi:hypothetical protein